MSTFKVTLNFQEDLNLLFTINTALIFKKKNKLHECQYEKFTNIFQTLSRTQKYPECSVTHLKFIKLLAAIKESLVTLGRKFI